MRVFNQGSVFRVTASPDDIETFAESWPCSGFHYGDRVSFTFEKSTGDLVDLAYSHCYGYQVDPERVDGGAMVALSQDAQAYGEKRLGIDR
jgi:hypothetical protein